MLSTSDVLTLSFGFASTLLATIAVFITRRASLAPPTTDLERPPSSRYGAAIQVHEDMVMEEMYVRRWSTVKKSNAVN